MQSGSQSRQLPFASHRVAAAMYGLVSLAAIFIYTRPNSPSTLFSLRGVLLLQGIALPALSVAIIRFRGRPISSIPVSKPTPGDLRVGVAGGGVIAVCGLCVLGALGIGGEITIFEGPTVWYTPAQEFLLLAVVSAVVIGPSEELLFRGVIQPALADHLPAAGWAISITTGLFTIAHLPRFIGVAGGGSFAVINIAFISVISGIVQDRTENTLIPAFVHGFYNASINLLMFAAALGSTPQGFV